MLQRLAADRPSHVLQVLGWACFGVTGMQCVSYHETATADFETLLAQKAVAPNLAAQAAWHTARAVSHLHDRGIVRRNITPENVLLFCSTGVVVKLGGFQLALCPNPLEERLPPPHTVGVHKAPEQWLQAPGHGRAYREAADFWALGWLSEPERNITHRHTEHKSQPLLIYVFLDCSLGRILY